MTLKARLLVIRKHSKWNILHSKMENSQTWLIFPQLILISLFHLNSRKQFNPMFISTNRQTTNKDLTSKIKITNKIIQFMTATIKNLSMPTVLLRKKELKWITTMKLNFCMNWISNSWRNLKLCFLIVIQISQKFKRYLSNYQCITKLQY